MKVKVTVPLLNVRKQPVVKEDNIICELEEGAEVEFISFAKKWCKIKLDDGTIGFCLAKYTNAEELEV